ncbi:sensor histidine kinase [Halorubrum vacuolatum]|uniref:histidine kinase n=1 Tax=Halorubrum vacuolatum TaxID=63740 RepID=A0A238USK9_HALVU|nr:histidine kinase N-terminal 7TM domain-containing protein [Halorubrum vacuolatum]SNR24329.1 His Kinase A (phospho-acceptor) domain-containing protein [Halorubrum vacuolatum]
MEHSLFIAYVAVHLLSVLFAGTFGYWAIARSEMRSRRWFGLLMAGVAVWALLATAGLLIVDYSTLVILQIASFGIGLMMPILWLLFTADYTHRPTRSNTVIRGFVVVYLLLLITALTTPFHGYYASFTLHREPLVHLEIISGPVRFVAIAYIFAGMVLGTYYLAGLLERGRSQITTSTLILAGSVLLGIVPFIASILGIGPVPTYDHTPFGISVFVLGVGYVAFRYDFYALDPIARDIVINDIADAILVFDDRLRLLDYNTAARSIVSDLDDGRLGTPLSQLHPDLAALIGETSDGQEMELTVPDVDGDRYYLVKTSEIMLRVEPIGTVVVLRDVTELRERERQLARQNERLNQFASVVSHDLRNPLNVAMGRTALAAEECDSEHLPDVSRALSRMETMIEDLLILAREGKSVGERERLDLEEVAIASWQHVETSEATITIADPATFLGDRSRVIQAFENLFRNAIEHGGDSVAVVVGITDDDRGVFVADTGPGIPEERREEVFESGFTTNREGTGFGLAIVKQICDAHGWDISVAEVDAGGTRFEITGIDSIER